MRGDGRAWKHWTTRALKPFVAGTDAPYRSDDGVLVMPATLRNGVIWGTPVRRSVPFHLVTGIAVAWAPAGPVVGARWLCGKGSVGVNLYDPAKYAARLYGSAEDFDVDEHTCSSCIAARDGESPAFVYRVYDKTGDRLLYIGSTKNWPARKNQHKAQTWWWPLAKNVQLTRYPTERLARAAEVEAIRSEHPRMNIAHNREEASA